MKKVLHVLQDGYRLSQEEMARMHKFVAEGGYFTADALRKHNPLRHGLIALSQTEDGELWIRDGLHRITVIAFYHRPLRADEYFIEQRSYVDYQTINLERTWVTPFDPRIEVRTPNFFDFKEEAMKMAQQGIDPTEFILANKHRYCVPRNGQADFELELL